MKKIVNQIRFIIAVFFMYITMEERATTPVAGKRKVYLAKTLANVLFVKRFQDTERYADIEFVLCKVTYMGRNQVGKMITMMTLPSTGQVITARIAFGDAHEGQVTTARTIKTQSATSTWVTFTSAEITALGVLINTFEDAHGPARTVAYNALNVELKMFCARVQGVADANTDGNAIVIIQSCGFHVQGVGGSHEQVFDCFNGVASGTVMLIAPAGGPHTCNDWWYSLDNVNWTRMPPTVNANTMMAGLPVGHLAFFRHETIESTGGRGLSQTIEIMVK